GYINGSLTDLGRLKSIGYDASSVASYSLKNIRNRETALGNLVADSLMASAKTEFGDQAPEIALAHSAGIRAGIKPNEPITHYDLSNMIMNSGNPAKEREELVIITKLTGKNIRDILEFGVHDLTAPNAGQKPGLMNNLGSLLHDGSATAIPAD